MIIRSIKPVSRHPFFLHFNVITTSGYYGVMSLEGDIIEVLHGKIPFKEIDDLEIAIRSCPLIVFDASAPYSELSVGQLAEITRELNKRLLLQIFLLPLKPTCN